MSNELGSAAATRNAGVARIRRLTRFTLLGAALLSGAFAGLAEASTHLRKATHVRTQPARRAVTKVPVPAPVVTPAPSSAQIPAPSQVPTQSTVPPVATSGTS